MIDLTALTKAHIGSWVRTTFQGPEQIGRIKSFNTTTIFVVYACNKDWDHYYKYTGCSTRPEDLEFR